MDERAAARVAGQGGEGGADAGKEAGGGGGAFGHGDLSSASARKLDDGQHPDAPIVQKGRKSGNSGGEIAASRYTAAFLYVRPSACANLAQLPSLQEVSLPQALSNVLGFPRIGPQRELKSATESYWSGDRSMEDLLGTAKELRAANWKLQRDAGIDLIPSNDFSLYDQVLDTVAMVGAVPARYELGRHRATSTSTPTSRWRAAARPAAST